ncbi:hypothetical protein [Virgibacillus sediminis]|uniref:DUF3993 domain-containing protein n=1 Tax=Virgibacillus sediminis TaxID=202260 RepID=A0ABV7A2E5_9BACI
MKYRDTKRYLTILSGLILTALLISTINTYGLPHVIAKDHGESETQSVKKEIMFEEVQPSHKEIIRVTNQFMDILVQDVDEQYRVLQHKTKEGLLQSFDEVADRGVSEPYVDYYYTEKSEGLYLLPTETPPWFDENNSYDMVQLEDDKVKVIQKNDSVLYGTYQIEIEFTLYKDEWLITDVTHF